MAMRDDILKAIQDGGATRDSLLELTGTTEKGLASQFTYLRMLGHCPMKQEDGTYKIVSAEEWAEHRSSGPSSAPLTPKQRVEKAEKRIKRAATAYDNAEKRKEANPEDAMTKWKFVKAEAELRIAEIEQSRAEKDLADAIAAGEVEADEPETDESEELVEEEPTEEDETVNELE